MNWGLLLYRVGALGLVLSLGVFFQGPLAASLQQGSAGWSSSVILFGFVGVAGLLLLFVSAKTLLEGRQGFLYATHGAALLSILWLILWCFDWLAILMGMGDKAVMFIKHSAYLHLFGVGFSMAGYATGWMTPMGPRRTLRFLMTVGWAVSYMAWFNLYLQPQLAWLWAPAIGGLLVVLGAFGMARVLNPKVEASSPLA